AKCATLLGIGDEYPEIVTREEWCAKPPKEVEKLQSLPVPFVVIHHTYKPPACNTTEDCDKAMREMQRLHQDDRKWWDIGYNFCVGGTGKVYEGRGWDVQGAHAPRYNNRSCGICFIGDYTETIPTEEMIHAAKGLINLGVKRGSIAENYKLIGHRQVRDTLCPGDAFFKEIKTWNHWDPLIDVAPNTNKSTTT
ncbi:hypothetical protein L9F63_009931, partial [Diploptera punctata]